MRSRGSLLALAGIALSCTLPEAEPLPPDTFAFAVFGDGPYRPWETMRFRRVIADANRTPLEWFGAPDIGWVRVVVDSVTGRFVAFDPRLMPRWLRW